MADLLLLGAGFSRNWGGWLASEAFEYLLGCPEIAKSAQLRDRLWKHQTNGGFEDALDELQAAYLRDPRNHEQQLFAFQSAVSNMFADMNNAFLELIDWEFQRQDREKLVQAFVTRFDAIFTLNQDIFLEKHYCNSNVSLLGTRGWSGAYFPGMNRTPHPEPLFSGCLARATWTPRAEGSFTLEPRTQPIFKLHGSSNWKSADGKPLLVMGGAKPNEISRHPILRWYAQEFESRLVSPGTRLMVIGYGFKDRHINDAIAKAVGSGLRMFIIAPAGAELAFALSPTRANRQIIVESAEELMLKQSLIGASRRPLRDIFGGDGAEFHKVMRFFTTT
jgi:hypothetical protein